MKDPHRSAMIHKKKKERRIKIWVPIIIYCILFAIFCLIGNYYIYNDILLIIWIMIGIIPSAFIYFLVKYIINNYYEKKEKERLRKIRERYY